MNDFEKALIAKAIKERELRANDPSYVVPSVLRNKAYKQTSEKINPDPNEVRNNLPYRSDVYPDMYRNSGAAASQSEYDENTEFPEGIQLRNGLPVLSEENEQSLYRSIMKQESGAALTPREQLYLRTFTR